MAPSGTVPDYRTRAYIALAGSLALHAILLSCLPSLPRSPLAGATPPPLAVELARPRQPTAAAVRRHEPAATPTEPSSAASSPMPPPAAVTPETDPSVPLSASPSPRFDPDALRQQARAQERGGRKAPQVAPQNLGQTLPTPTLERETPLSRSIAKAQRPDCKTAYAGVGLIAIPLLLLDTARDKGCRW